MNDLLERAIAYTLGGLPHVGDLSDPTPCRDWDVRALLSHMEDALTALHEAGLGHVDMALAAPTTSADPVGAVRDRAGEVLGVWSAQSGVITVADCPVTAEVVAIVGAIEVAVHGWDLTRRPIPRALASDLWELAPMVVLEDDRPGRFGPAVALPSYTDPRDRLLAFLGRVPG